MKNQSLGFSIPYTLDGTEHRYVPDFITHAYDGVNRENKPEYLNLVIEVTGQRKKDETALPV